MSINNPRKWAGEFNIRQPLSACSTGPSNTRRSSQNIVRLTVFMVQKITLCTSDLGNVPFTTLIESSFTTFMEVYVICHEVLSMGFNIMFSSCHQLEVCVRGSVYNGILRWCWTIDKRLHIWRRTYFRKYETLTVWLKYVSPSRPILNMLRLFLYLWDVCVFMFSKTLHPIVSNSMLTWYYVM